ATIRHHEGVFYIITTCKSCGENFYITSTNPSGKWSDPIWLKDAKGIDPSLFWDDDGRCYYTGNSWDFKESRSGQCAIWGQELDLKKQKLIGEAKILSYGHAINARYTEAPHLYKINNRYLLLTAEGGTNENHAVTSHHSANVLGTYTADQNNPVLTHRNLGSDYPIQAVGHADLVQTQNGDWWAVVLGKRFIGGETPLSRETFLCKVAMENGTPIFNPGQGKVLLEQERPGLPWTPISKEPFKDEFDKGKLANKWHTIKTPFDEFYSIQNGQLKLKLKPQTIDSLSHFSILIQPIKQQKFSATTKLSFSTKKDNEKAGIVLYRNDMSYYLLTKEKNRVLLIKKDNGEKEVIADLPYDKNEVYLGIEAKNLGIQFRFGETLNTMSNIGETQSFKVFSDSDINKFNGTGVGVYASSNEQKSDNTATFDWFEYKH
ncbi:MAG: family 43 glycosylhydrolase, partial [Ferruginibacter sp.]